ncbi:MAG: tyrosine-protein kinase [Thermomicrobiales bacterium]|jgi:non-specific protein-tyrosine kinase|nr:tyrosine-protein kinase [Thermomicrobiales bacterium]MEA2583537.1 tyrosine-protein kinase [Thermomicrobiales bacterium]MEA2596595.1 tyrosine-protein kinase [Thermomicrobiales bacterium]
MELDLRQVMRILRRWWWIAGLVPLLLGALAFGITSRQQPKYAATATLFINPAAGSGTLDYNSILTAERLSKTYQKLAKNRTVLDQVIADLQLPMDASDLAGQITAQADGETQLLSLTVSDTDPARAATIANAVAQRFQSYVVDDLSSSSTADIDSINNLLKEIETEIETVQSEIERLQAQPNAGDPTVQGQIDALNARLQESQSAYGRLLSLSADLRAYAAVSGSQIQVAVPAVAPKLPYAPNKPVNVMLGVIAGAILAMGVILVLEYRDNTVKVASDFGALVGAPLLSTVTAIPKLNQGRKQLFVLEHPKGGAAEAIRLLRTNIEFASATKEIATLGITSANPGEGKSTMAANLAVTLAQAGFVTALIDADLRRPSQHRIFGVGNDRGLSTLLSTPERAWEWGAHQTMLPNLTLIPSGPLPPNPADLLSLERMRELLAEMRHTFDVIVLDTPPALVVSDPLIVAAHVDGMILVSRSGKTRVDALRRAAATMQRGAVRIIGVIVNQQSGRDSEGYYYTEYHAVDESPRGGRRGGRSESPVSLSAREQSPAD